MSIKIERYLMHCKECNNTFWALMDMRNNLPDVCMYCGAANSKDPHKEPDTVDFVSREADYYEVSIDQRTGIPFLKHHEQVLRKAEMLASISHEDGRIDDGFRTRECVLSMREELRKMHENAEKINKRRGRHGRNISSASRNEARNRTAKR
ncbi:hypothetical protein TCA2_4427 [Paenibacillus sp. TCA20]|nr:hypothetical protein TCA2_4427 [Paenibacillus sp. TCA20]